MFPYLRGLQYAHPIKKGVDTVLICYILVREDEDAYEVFFNAPMRIFHRQKDALSYHSGLDHDFNYAIMRARVNMTTMVHLEAD